MPYFPQLSSAGLTVQRPYTSEQHALTTFQDQATGRRWARSWRTNPLALWRLEYASLTDAELATLETFFGQQQGRYGEWGYLDPGGNLVKYSEDFTQADWVKSNVTLGAAQVDPFGSSRAAAATGTLAGAYLEIALEPTGINGRVLCASVWVKATTGGLTASVGFDDGGNQFTSYSLVSGVWQRITHPRNISSVGPVKVRVGLDAGTYHVFGAQCSVLPAPGAYARSPQNYGYHAKCRFDSDTLVVRYLGPDQNAASVAIAEYA